MMSLGKMIPAAVCGLLFSFQLSAQYHGQHGKKVEIGINIGVTEFLGDLGGGNGEGRAFISDTDFRYTRPAIGVYYARHFNKWFALSGHLNFTQARGSDTATDYAPRQNRNLHFKTNIVELYGLARLSPFGIGERFRFHTFGGMGIFHFNPKAEYEGDWVELQPLGTEGQGLDEYPDRKKYKLTQFMIPLGMGASFQIADNWTLGMDIMHRVTFTDYIDDVSTTYVNPDYFYNNYNPNTAAMAADLSNQHLLAPADGNMEGGIRGNPEHNDSYYSLLFRLGYTFGSGGGIYGRGKNIGCPGQL